MKNLFKKPKKVSPLFGHNLKLTSLDIKQFKQESDYLFILLLIKKNSARAGTISFTLFGFFIKLGNLISSYLICFNFKTDQTKINLLQFQKSKFDNHTAILFIGKNWNKLFSLSL